MLNIKINALQLKYRRLYLPYKYAKIPLNKAVLLTGHLCLPHKYGIFSLCVVLKIFGLRYDTGNEGGTSDVSEKNLTQEQLAEKLNVAGRTVSRWENGNNMPDLSIIVELADFYDVDIRELINGERKSEEIMDKDLKETGLKMADYAEAEKAKLSKRLFIISIVGLISFFAAVVLGRVDFVQDSPLLSLIEGYFYGITIGALIVNILYCNGALSKIRSKKQGKKFAKILLFVSIAITIIGVMGAICHSFIL